MVITKFKADLNGSSQDFCTAIDNNFKALVAQDQKAKDDGQLVGRYIQEQYADSHAYYVIVKENKKTVRIGAVSGIGDDWQIPYWGEEATIEKDYALNSIGFRDRMEELVKKQRS